MSLDLTDDKSTLAQVMAWCHQATSHYLSQCWPRSMSPYVTRPQWVKIQRQINVHIYKWPVLPGCTGPVRYTKEGQMVNPSLKVHVNQFMDWFTWTLWGRLTISLSLDIISNKIWLESQVDNSCDFWLKHTRRSKLKITDDWYQKAIKWWHQMICKEISQVSLESTHKGFHSLWPSDVIWWNTTWSVWVQILACCLMAPTH